MVRPRNPRPRQRGWQRSRSCRRLSHSSRYWTAGFGFSLFAVWWETALAHHIPAHALSRVSAYDWMGSLALLPLGFAIAGPLAVAFGSQTVLAAGSVLAFVMLALALLPRSTRERLSLRIMNDEF